MSGTGPWRAHADLWGSLACARAAGGEGRCWIASSGGRTSQHMPQRCRALADCVDAQLAGFGYGWLAGSIRPLAAEPVDPTEEIDPYVADVLRSDTTLVASFACPLEAVRYAALLYEPGCAPLLRRRWDRAVKAFSPTASTPGVLRWLVRPDPRD